MRRIRRQGGHERRGARSCRRPLTIDEFAATFKDDDKDFVGEIDAESGLFTPTSMVQSQAEEQREQLRRRLGRRSLPRNVARDSVERPTCEGARASARHRSAYIMFDQPRLLDRFGAA
jgi:hypothetical protein